MKSMSEVKVSGSLAAMFSSTSITSIVIGILFYMEKESFLVVHTALGPWSGIWLYSYVIWIILFAIGYVALRGRKEVGSLRTWLLVFALSIIIGTLMIESHLEWSSLFE